MKEYKLCYIADGFAYFTNIPLEEQWGDDWDDAPYEYNAGSPYYDGNPDQIKILAFIGDFKLPCTGHVNSSYSVKDINKGIIPWLRTWDNRDMLYAGAAIGEFIDFVKRNGGRVFKEI